MSLPYVSRKVPVAAIALLVCAFAYLHSVAFCGESLERSDTGKRVLLVELDSLIQQWALVKLDRLRATGQKHVDAYGILYERYTNESEQKEKQKYETLARRELALIDEVKAEIHALAARMKSLDKNAVECREALEAVEKYRASHGYEVVYATKNSARLGVKKAPKTIVGTDGTRGILEYMKDNTPNNALEPTEGAVMPRAGAPVTPAPIRG